MIVLIIFLLAAASLQASDFMVRSDPYDLILWRYYNSHPPALLVNIEIGADPPKGQINYSIFQDWQTLHLTESNHPHQAINSQSSFIFRYNSNQTSFIKSNAVSLNLDEICERYFTEKPTFMVLSHHNIDYLLEDSTFWAKSYCIPQLLLLKFSQYSSKTLEENKWALIERAGNYAIYLHHSSQAEYNERWANATKTEQTLPTLEWNTTFSSIKKFIASNNKTAQDDTQKPVFKIYDVKQKIISIGDILGELPIDSSEISHIVMKNYNADYNVIITGNNAARTILNVSNFVIQNITVGQKISFLFPRLPSQKCQLISGGSIQTKCVNPYDVEEQVFVKIRGNDDKLEQLKAQSFMELGKVQKSTKPKSADATDKPTPTNQLQIEQNIIKPENLTNEKQKNDDKAPLTPTKQIKQDKIILIVMAGILILTLAVFVVRQICIKWQLRSRMKILTKIKQIKQAFEEISVTQSQNKLQDEDTI